MGWYGNFISVSMERTLVLYDDSLEMIEGSIPDVIFKSYMGLWRFPDVDEIMEEVCVESRVLAEKILSEHPGRFMGEIIDWGEAWVWPLIYKAVYAMLFLFDLQLRN